MLRNLVGLFFESDPSRIRKSFKWSLEVKGKALTVINILLYMYVQTEYTFVALCAGQGGSTFKWLVWSLELPAPPLLTPVSRTTFYDCLPRRNFIICGKPDSAN